MNSASVIACLWLRSNLHSFAADFSTIDPLLQEHCVECHSAKDPDGGLSLDSHASLLKGGESGPVVVAGKSTESLLIKALEGNWDKTGKNQFMPPGKRDKLKPEQIALFKTWIDAGAPAPSSTAVPRELIVPVIAPKGPPRRPINALSFEPKSRLLAVARPDAVELFNVDSRKIERTLTDLRGAANAVVFSADGQFVFAGAGDATGGEVRQWKTADGSLVRTLGGHHDAVYALSITADGQSLASGGYDYTIKLWNLTEGSERATIAANQGAIMALAFRPDGRLLASSGYDRTAKIYDSATGTRLETFGQALKELNAIAFSPDGRTLFTGGNDNRIRAYRIGPEGKEGSNELVATVFAHEGAILRIAVSPDGKSVASSADDHTVKVLDAELQPRLTLEAQPDWPTALVFAGNGILAVGRADGSLGLYNPTDGKSVPRPKPELIRTEPRGIERGRSVTLKLIGKNLDPENVTVVSVFRSGQLWAAMAPEFIGHDLTVTLTPPADEPAGAWEISVGNGAIESVRNKVWVDDLPQQTLLAVAGGRVEPTCLSLDSPSSLWCTFEKPGTAAEFSFTAKVGQTLVFDISAQRLGAKGDYAITLLDSQGRTLAANDNIGGQLDPLLFFTASADGTNRVRVTEATFAGSPDHFFRLSVGALPFVTGVFPLSVPANEPSEVEILGVNLHDGRTAKLTGGDPGEMDLPEPANTWRARRDWKFQVTGFPAPLEAEPNDTASQANSVPIPVSVNGRLLPRGGNGSVALGLAPRSPGDVDHFRFSARRGATYVLETAAATRGSLADTRLEVLWSDGKLVERVRLKAMRNSAITFRPETSDESGIRFENWEEMELNDLLWCGGEVMKLFRAPQGPDSDSVLYTANGLRCGFFDTTPVAHYLEEPVYFVTPLAPGEEPVPNGLPVFTIYYSNEDAALRDLGTDSRVYFTAPTDGEFLARVTDAREFGGPTYSYQLIIREARPDFSVTVSGPNSSVAAGSGQAFSVSVKRQDGFDGPVEVAFNQLPEGWSVPNPLTIEGGHDTAFASLNAATNATAPDPATWDAVSVVATAVVKGRSVALAVNNLGQPKLASELPKLLVRLEPITEAASATSPGSMVVIQPGGTARAKLSIERRGFDGVVSFSVDNLPHGVIVENLGLNGITFLAGENEREISLAAAKWVGDLERPFFAVENQAGRQTSRPLWLKVRRNNLQADAR